MPNIQLPPDTLDEQAARFEQQPLRQPVFLNSVPKSGSHLLRNIVRMFVAPEQQYQADFIQFAALREHLYAFDPARPQLSWGHLLFADSSAIATATARKILLVRDPFDWVLSRARFLLSESFEGELDFLRKAPITTDQLLSLVIFGIPRKLPNLRETYMFNAAAWLGPDVHLVRYEDLVAQLKQLDSEEAAQYFTALFDACGIAMPDDWRERVRIGSDRKHSGTAREHLAMHRHDIPDQLSPTLRSQVEVAAPGMRQILGYTGN